MILRVISNDKAAYVGNSENLIDAIQDNFQGSRIVPYSESLNQQFGS